MNVYEYLKENGCDDFFEPEVPECHTSAPPGSAEKISVLRRRVLSGKSLWHPHDVTDCTGVRKGEKKSKKGPH